MTSTVLVLLAATVAVSVALVSFSSVGGFWMDAQQFAATGRITSVFTPFGYPALLGLGLRAGGIAGVIFLQLLLYLLILAAVYGVLRLLHARQTTAVIGAGLLGFHPDLIINIKKIWDTNATTAMLLLLCAALLAVLRHGLTPARAAVTGILWGLSINVRPNFPALILPIALAFWLAPVAAHRTRTMLISGTLTIAVAAMAVASVSMLVHGAFYIPQNGPYDLYAGDNAFTQRALLDNLNAEYSIYPALLAAGFPANVDIYDPGLRPYYVHHALLYLRQDPLRALKLVLLKFITLLRPDTKIYPAASLGGIVKALLALAIPVWLMVLIVLRQQSWQREDWLFVVFVVAYVTPFLLTNADPRFRIPLDILVLTHAFSRIAREQRAAIVDEQHG